MDELFINTFPTHKIGCLFWRTARDARGKTKLYFFCLCEQRFINARQFKVAVGFFLGGTEYLGQGDNELADGPFERLGNVVVLQSREGAFTALNQLRKLFERQSSTTTQVREEYAKVFHLPGFPLSDKAALRPVSMCPTIYQHVCSILTIPNHNTSKPVRTL